MNMSNYNTELDEMVERWQHEADSDHRDSFKYREALADLLYHGAVRYRDYEQYRIADGPFPLRLLRWLRNVTDNKERKRLFQLLHWFVFFDDKQMKALYRDAYRRIICPWATLEFSRDDLLSPELEAMTLRVLRRYHFRSLTESFNVSMFKQVNEIQGLPKMQILGENEDAAIKNIQEAASNDNKAGLIFLEDYVGTGTQASRILDRIMGEVPDDWRCLFVPLIIQHSGLTNVHEVLDEYCNTTIEPVYVIPESRCVKRERVNGEPREFNYFRSVVLRTERQVLQPFEEDLDDAPVDPFGYEGSGGLIVTSHNTPNNTLPLIHHKNNDWNPLFRRIHHSKE